MILLIAVIAIIAAIGYIWASRGFYSAFLNMVATVIAGAIALSVWEPLAYYFMGAFGTQWLVDISWSLALLLPFCVMVAVLSALLNAALPANIQCSGTVNWVGGGLCALVSAVIGAGIFSSSVSMIRAKSDFLGHTPIEIDANGSPIRTGGLLIPVDRLVGAFYGYLSENAFRTDTSLAMYRPQFVDEPHLLRLGPSDMFLLYSLKPGDVKMRARYTIGESLKINQIPVSELVGDKKQVKRIDGETISKDSYVEGYVIQFGAGAKETNGQVIIGPGQLTLVMRSGDDEHSIAVQPFAMISQASGDDPAFMGRWRFDAKETFIPSAGAGADPQMAFEFLVPRLDPPYLPLALYVKGIRLPIAELGGETQSVRAAGQSFSSMDRYREWYERDGIRDLASMNSTKVEINPEGATKLSLKPITEGNAVLPIRMSNTIGERLNKGNMRGLELDEKKLIINGDATFALNELLESGVDRSLFVEKFHPGDKQIIVKVDVGFDSVLFLRSGISESAVGAPALLDQKGQRFECIGYVYKDRTNLSVRFTPGKPIIKKEELPSLSKNDNSRKLTLLFRCSQDSVVTKYVIGTQLIVDITPGMRLDQPQTTR